MKQVLILVNFSKVDEVLLKSILEMVEDNTKDTEFKVYDANNNLAEAFKYQKRSCRRK